MSSEMEFTDKVVTLTKSELMECLSAVQVAVNTAASVNAWTAHDKYEKTYKLLKNKLEEL